jgi:Secretion system C-terminal sorting domain/Right handed beta helix region
MLKFLFLHYNRMIMIYLKKLVMKKIFLVILFFLNINLVYSLNYYVDKMIGLDTNSGLTLTSAFKTIQKAAITAQAGSTIFIKGGIYNENIIINISGTATNPIVFRNYNSDLVYIDGTGTSTANNTAMLQINGASHLEFRNLIIQNLLCQDANGIVVYNNPVDGTTDLKFINITIHDIKWTQLATTIPTNNDNAHPFLVYGSGNTQASAITNVLVDGCNIYNNVTGFSENLTHSGNVDGFVVQNNFIHDNSNIGIECEGNYGASPTPILDHARNGLVKNNKCYENNSPYSSSAGIYVDGGWNIIVEQNECFNNTYGVEIGCEENGTTKNIIVKNNVLYNNRESGIYLGGYDPATTGQVLNATIRNNTLFKNNTILSSSGEIEISKAYGCRIENNIIYANNTKVLYNLNNIFPVPDVSFDYNCYYTPNNNSGNIIIFNGDVGYTNFNIYQNFGIDFHSIYSNPQFVNEAQLIGLDLSLQNTSPCLNAGNPAVFGPIEFDFFGNPRLISTVDIGAIEYQSLLSNNNFVDNKETKIYPNPFTEYLQVDSKEEINSIEIFNNLGQISFKSENSFPKLYVSSLNSGLYLIKINYKNGTISNHKILKL